MGPGRGKHVVALDRKKSRRVCDDCVSMLAAPEELESAPARPNASAQLAEIRDAANSPSSVTDSTVRATASTTVALAVRGPGYPAATAAWLALAAATLAATGIVWLLLFSGPR